MVADQDVVVYRGATLRELAPSGADRIEVDEETWRADIDDPWMQSLVLPEDCEVVYGTQKGRVCALGPSRGEESWCVHIETLRDAQPRVLVEGDTVGAVTTREEVALDRADGARRWTFGTEDGVVRSVRPGAG